MEVHCTEEFKTEFEKICKNKKYPDCEKHFIDYFFGGGNYAKAATGQRIFGHISFPLFKKRIPDSGGYRYYFFPIKEKECILLGLVYPKTGNLGSDNIENETKRLLLDQAINSLKSKSYYHIRLDKNGNLTFITIEELKGEQELAVNKKVNKHNF